MKTEIIVALIGLIGVITSAWMNYQAKKEEKKEKETKSSTKTTIKISLVGIVFFVLVIFIAIGLFYFSNIRNTNCEYKQIVEQVEEHNKTIKGIRNEIIDEVKQITVDGEIEAHDEIIKYINSEKKKYENGDIDCEELQEKLKSLKSKEIKIFNRVKNLNK